MNIDLKTILPYIVLVCSIAETVYDENQREHAGSACDMRAYDDAHAYAHQLHINSRTHIGDPTRIG